MSRAYELKLLERLVASSTRVEKQLTMLDSQMKAVFFLLNTKTTQNQAEQKAKQRLCYWIAKAKALETQNKELTTALAYTK